MIVIGVDGLDPDLLTKFMADGKMPNFARLAQQGSFKRLTTSIPPQSPVAWSNLITGMNAGGHGIFDFIHRAMPFNAPQSLSNDEVYALTAYVLSLNGIVAADTVLDAQTLPKIKMPNRDGFIDESAKAGMR